MRREVGRKWDEWKKGKLQSRYIVWKKPYFQLKKKNIIYKYRIIPASIL